MRRRRRTERERNTSGRQGPATKRRAEGAHFRVELDWTTPWGWSRSGALHSPSAAHGCTSYQSINGPVARTWGIKPSPAQTSVESGEWNEATILPQAPSAQSWRVQSAERRQTCVVPLRVRLVRALLRCRLTASALQPSSPTSQSTSRQQRCVSVAAKRATGIAHKSRERQMRGVREASAYTWSRAGSDLTAYRVEHSKFV
eukprot:5001430-Pleurochrysis_carterae.AAC.3